MTLPKGFATLPAARQLLVLTNIERVDRGLRAFPGLSKRLNSLAAKGARANTDPGFKPFKGTAAGSNWAGVGTSTLMADYVWMYDDGLGSPNGDCTKASPGNCWGHRHNILADYDKPLVMGAAVAHHGASIAAEYVGGDSADHAAAAHWSHYRRQLPVGLSTKHLVVRAPAGGSGHRRLTIWASGEAMHVTLRLAAGTPGWSISRSSCRLKAGHSCSVTVTARSADGAVHHTSLSVTGPNGKTSVRLAGRPTG
jgi:VCBS repeat-containing protein